MVGTVVRTLWSHWRRHPGQALTLLAGVALATALWTGVQAINAEARASYDRAARVVDQNGLPILIARDASAIPLADYVALRRGGWPVAPVLEGSLRLDGRQVTVLGLDPLSTPVLPQAAAGLAAEGGGGLAAFIGPPGQVFAAPDTAARSAGRIGGTVVASPDLAPDLLVMDIARAADLLARPATLTRLVLLDEPPAAAGSLADLAPGLVESRPETGAGLEGLTRSFHLNLTAFGLLAFTVGLFIAHGAIGLAFEQRRPMFRTLRAVGVSGRVLSAALALELTAVAVIAGALGIALGYVMAAALLPDVAATLRGLYGAPAAQILTLRTEWVVAGLAMAGLGVATAGASSLWRMAALPVLAGARPRAWAQVSELGLKRSAVAAVTLLALAAALVLAGRGLLAGFATLGALLTGAALALPPVLAAVLALAARSARGPVSGWFWADTRQQLPGLSLALMALLLALSANIGVSTMVGSFRMTFLDWLDRRLSAEVYIRTDTAAEAALLQPWLDARADAVLPRADTEVRLMGTPGTLEALSDHATYRADWPLTDPGTDGTQSAWARWAAGGGVMINEQLATRADLSPGDKVQIDGRGMPVLGVYADYGNPRPQAAMEITRFEELYPDVPIQRFALRLPPGDIAAFATALQDEAGLRPDQIIDNVALKAASRRIFERTFAVTGALNVLTLGVAGLAMLTSLLTLAQMRLPQVAPLWATGLTRRQLGMLELLRAGALALLTAAFALPVGLVLAWVLLSVVNVEAFGWRLPMVLFPGDWLRLTALAVLAAVLAAAWSARRLATRPPAELLRVFASDR